MRRHAFRLSLGALAVLLALTLGSTARLDAQEPGAALDDALRAFYSARYDTAAALTLDPCTASTNGPAACELRTTALLFQIRRGMGDGKDREAAWKQCASCPEWLTAFNTALARGQEVARGILKERPEDDETLFLLGKLDLNFVWLRLGTMGNKTGWGEYWEARKSLDAVLKRRPDHIRARVARGWIDYIVDTKMKFGTKWLLGGGSKKKGLQAIRDAAGIDSSPFFTRAEARFALWDMQVREKDTAGAMATAQLLLEDFPENHELAKFIAQK